MAQDEVTRNLTPDNKSSYFAPMLGAFLLRNNVTIESTI